MSNEENEKLLKLASWVLISSYRNRVMIALGNKFKTPSTLARESGIRTNHISKVLNELKGKELVVCINEDASKGRLYKMTDLGNTVMKKTKMLRDFE